MRAALPAIVALAVVLLVAAIAFVSWVPSGVWVPPRTGNPLQLCGRVAGAYRAPSPA